MKTDLFAINKLYDLMIKLGVKELISGNLYKQDNRKNSTLEDVLISCEENYNGDPQTFLMTLCLCIPDKQITDDAGTTTYIADLDRIQTLTQWLIDKLNYLYDNEYNLEVNSQITRKAPQGNEHFSLIQITLNQFNFNS